MPAGAEGRAMRRRSTSGTSAAGSGHGPGSGGSFHLGSTVRRGSRLTTAQPGSSLPSADGGHLGNVREAHPGVAASQGGRVAVVARAILEISAKLAS